MELYYKDNHITIYNKDCCSMEELENESVQMVVTSPPYWGLRKYAGLPNLVWGDNHCEHQWQRPPTSAPVHPVNRRCEMCQKFGLTKWLTNTSISVWCWECQHETIYSDISSNELKTISKPKKNITEQKADMSVTQGNTCSLCGAWKGSYGLEPRPEMYIEHSIEILREIRRVLRKDGVVFWNIGDSYIAGTSVGRQDKTKYGGKEGLHCLRAGIQSYGEWTGPKARAGDGEFKKKGMSRVIIKHPVLKQKDLCLIPFRLAIACQEDGWWVRSVIIWSKPNPMPESVTDRPTESHEYILMLTKSARYYWDADAVREPHQTWDERNISTRAQNYRGKFEKDICEDFGSPRARVNREGYEPSFYNPAGRNIRTVWEFPTQPFPEAHFAVFPEKLPEICIKAATPEAGCCSKCGAPWERITKIDYEPIRKSKIQDQPKQKIHPQPYGFTQYAVANKISKTLGWRPTCKCNADKVPSLVLDPFAGAGTTLWVAKKLGKRAVGYELSEEYCQLSVERNRQQALF